MHLDDVLETIRSDVADLNLTELKRLNAELDAKTDRTGSRYVGPNADPGLVAHLAAGGELRTAEPETARRVRAAKSPGLAGVMTKALSLGTGSAGGYLVESEISDEIMRQIRTRAAVRRMGVREVPVDKELSVTSLSTGATAYFVAEGAPIPPSEQTFAQAPLLRPKELAALVPISNRLLETADSNPAVEEILRTDLSEVLALREDLALLRGTGTGGEPLGVKNHTGLTAAPALGTNGRAITFDDLKAMVANLRATNAPWAKPGWIFNSRLLSSLELLKTTDGYYLGDSPHLLSFDATGGTGKLLGIPFVTTSQIPVNITTGSSSDSTEVYLSSDWAEAWLGIGSELRIEASADATYTADGGTTWKSAWQSREHVFRAVMAEDFALRRPAFFTVMTGVRP